MPYNPPAFSDVRLVIGQSYIPPSFTSITLQLSDDPLCNPSFSNVVSYVNSITFNYTGRPDFNPHATGIVVQYREVGAETWQTFYMGLLGTFTATNLKEATKYEFQLITYTDLTPNPRFSPPTTFTKSTNFLVTIQLFRDTEGNAIPGGIVIALPQNDILQKVQSSDRGSDLPNLVYARVNKTDSAGACGIGIPVGCGPVWIIAIPPQPTKSGAAVANLETAE